MKNQLLALALMTAGFVSCTDDSYDLDNISNDFRIGLNEYLPIASSEVKLKDILSEFKTDYISENPEGILTFEFDTVNRVNVKPIEIAFKESSYEFDLVAKNLVTISNNVIPANPSFLVEVPINLSVDDENGAGRIDEIHIKDGFLKFHIESNAFDAEALYIKNVNIPHDENNLFNEETGTIKVNLSNQILRFPEEGYVVTCEIATRSEYAGKDIPLTSKDVKIKVVMEESKLSYHKIKGSFKSNIEQIEYTDFYINLYDDNLDFDLNVIDPKLTITGMTNSGIPLACSVKRLVGKRKTKNPSKKDSVEAVFFKGLSYESKSYDFEFKHSQNENEEVEAFKETFDKNNGSLDEIFNLLPDSVSVRCGIKIVGNDDDPKTSFFLLDSTYVDLNIHAEVPLQIGEGSYITIKDTVDGIDIVEDVTDYQDGNFKFDDVEIFIEFENELPLEGTVTAKFCRADSVNGKVVLTHIENKKLDQTVKIPAAQIDANSGHIISATPSKKKIVVSDDMIEDIKKINAVDFTYKIKVPKGNVNGVVLTNNCGMSAKVYTHLKANISNKEK
ncbi:MAG: hypothetical protein K6E14_09375 [Paludibacteraceae bacterium]|nr:hypothetical protein [Paludibacteraceae bacterium]